MLDLLRNTIKIEPIDVLKKVDFNDEPNSPLSTKITSNNRNHILNFTNATSIDQLMCSLGIKSSCPCDPPDYYDDNKTGSYDLLDRGPCVR